MTTLYETCEDCGRPITDSPGTSGETVERGCGHGRSLCTDCAPGSCDECLTDARSAGVLSQYSAFSRIGGAS